MFCEHVQAEVEIKRGLNFNSSLQGNGMAERCPCSRKPLTKAGRAPGAARAFTSRWPVDVAMAHHARQRAEHGSTFRWARVPGSARAIAATLVAGPGIAVNSQGRWPESRRHCSTSSGG